MTTTEAIARMMKGIWTTLCSTHQMTCWVPNGSWIRIQLVTVARATYQEGKRRPTILETSTKWTSKRCLVKISTNSLKTQSGTLSPTKRWASSHGVLKETAVKITSSKQWRRSTCSVLRKIRMMRCLHLGLKLMLLAKTPTLPGQQLSAVPGRSTPHVSSRIGLPTMHPSSQGDRHLSNLRPQSKPSLKRATPGPHPGPVLCAVQLQMRPIESLNKFYNPLASESRKGILWATRRNNKSIINQRQECERNWIA